MSNLPLNIDLQQIFLHMLNFVILSGGLFFLLYKPVRTFMDKRTMLYESKEREIREKEAEAEGLKAELAERLKGACEEAEAIRAAARAEAAEIIERARTEAEEERARILAEARGGAAEQG